MGALYSMIFGGPKQYSKKYPIINDTQAGEDAFDLVKARKLENPNGVLATTAYLIKGALGSGVLASHAGFAQAGMVAVPATVLLGIYMCYCLHILVLSAQVIYKRTGIVRLSYPEVGKVSFAISPHACLRKWATPFKIFIDLIICLDLFGACTCYQLMMAKTIKQIVENTQNTSSIAMTPNSFDLRIYSLLILPFCIAICLVRRLDVLAKVSIIGNFLVFLCIAATVYYSLVENPKMTGMKLVTSPKGIFTFIGMTVFSMSCSGIVVAIETNMSQPHKFPYALVSGMFFIVIGIILIGFFGYSGWGDNCQAPVILHFPMSILPKILKGAIVFMLYITHAVNFWVPFQLLFYYLKKCHNPKRHLCMEYIYRAVIVCCCCGIAIVFPSVSKLMAFLGAFCLSFMAFILPAVISLAVHWDRPGLGKCKWRLWVAILIIIGGLVMFSAGTFVSVKGLIELFTTDSENTDEDPFFY